MFLHFDRHLYGVLLRLARREPGARARLVSLFVVLIVIPIYSGVTALLYAVDNLSPGLRRAKVRAPVFIVGHARSGTTLMHRLMVSDEQRFSFFMTYELLFPSLIQKRILRALGAIDRRLFRSFFVNKIIAAEDEALAESRDMHHVGLFVPEEDDFVLSASVASGLWVALFPGMPEYDVYYIDQWPQRRRDKIMAAYDAGVRRQLVLRGLDKTHCSKNPAFSGRVESLIGKYPDARIVVMVRDPREAIPSLLKMLKKTWQGQGWSAERIDKSLAALAEQSIHTYRHPLEALERHPETRSIVVDYRDLISDPTKTVTAVYDALELDLSPTVIETLKAQQDRARAHKSSHSYGLEEFGIDEATLKHKLADLFERFQWDVTLPSMHGVRAEGEARRERAGKPARSAGRAGRTTVGAGGRDKNEPARDA